MSFEKEWFVLAEEKPSAVDEMIAYAERAAAESETELPEERFEEQFLSVRGDSVYQ